MVCVKLGRIALLMMSMLPLMGTTLLGEIEHLILKEMEDEDAMVLQRGTRLFLSDRAN